MSSTSFYKQLLFISLPTTVAMILVHQLPILKPHMGIGFASLAFFIALSISMFYAGKAAASSPNKNAFTNAFLIFLMLKLFLCASLSIGYLKIAKPDTKLFVLPFFALYIIYTTFEVLFLIKLGQIQAKPKDE